MNPTNNLPEKVILEVDAVMKRADIVNNSFTHIFGEPTAREDYEGSEIKSMRESD